MRSEDSLDTLFTQASSTLYSQIGRLAALNYSEVDPELQDNESLDIREIIRSNNNRASELYKAFPPLIFLKIDSYWSESEYATVCKLASKHNIDGIIVGSTVPVAGNKLETIGGCGGKPCKDYSLAALDTVVNLL